MLFKILMPTFFCFLSSIVTAVITTFNHHGAWGKNVGRKWEETRTKEGRWMAELLDMLQNPEMSRFEGEHA